MRKCWICGEDLEDKSFIRFKDSYTELLFGGEVNLCGGRCMERFIRGIRIRVKRLEADRKAVKRPLIGKSGPVNTRVTPASGNVFGRYLFKRRN